MATEVKLPRLGQGMESGTIVKWLKGEGEPVKKREPLYELDTDKVTQEVEAEADGVLLKIVVDSGEVEVGRTIALIGRRGRGGRRPGTATRRRRPSSEAQARGRASRSEDEAQTEGSSRAGDGRPARARPGSGGRDGRGGDRRRRRRRAPDGRVKASPLARRLAREQGIDLAAADRHRARGPDRRRGRRARRGRAAPAAGRRPAAAPAGEVEEIQLTSTRKTIARRLTEAWQAPVFQLTVSADMTRAIELRERLVARLRDGETKPTVSDLLTKVAAPRRSCATRRSTRTSPATRSIRFPAAHVGIAVAAPNGLVVPVIRDADRRTIQEIAPAAPTSSAARATASSSATISRTARSRSRTSACTGSSSSSPC